ncbi:MAG: NUDIX domain-containing protein [bacterium]|nr:NUDIX domain-containing protein [bacterium]
MPISTYLQSLREHVGTALLLVPAVTAIIHNEQGEVLMVYTTDEMWGTPGGAIDPGESAAEAVVREVREELGVEVVPRAVLAVFRQHIVYPHGDQMDYTSIAFRCDVVSGDLSPGDGEVLRWQWVTPDEVARQGVPIPIHVLRSDYDGPPAF